MSKRKQQVTRNGFNKPSSPCGGEEVEYFNPIPDDLVINIFSRLPLKSIAQLRCVSKLWSSIIRRPNYNLLFPIKSLAAPRLLFAFKIAGDHLFFKSSRHPKNLALNTSLVTTPHYSNTISGIYNLSRPVCGLVCCKHVEKNYCVAMISNPITGESLTLPKLIKSKGKVRYCLGYDPIDNQFKVLRITWLSCGSRKLSLDIQVLTLGTPHLSWRKIECCTLHCPLKDNGICINGVLYYPAKLKKGKYAMVCFDVRSEKISFINIDQDMATKISSEPNFTLNLIDYKGKLGACNVNDLFELWVLNNAEEHRWSKHSNKMPHLWPHGMGGHVVSGGMIASGEIVLYPCNISSRVIYIFYYNLESNVFRRVRFTVQVSKAFDFYSRLYTFANYVKHVTLI